MTEPMCEQTMLTKMADMQRTIDQLEEHLAQSKKDVEELIELGTDQVVTERILGLEKQLEIAIDALEHYQTFENDKGIISGQLFEEFSVFSKIANEALGKIHIKGAKE